MSLKELQLIQLQTLIKHEPKCINLMELFYIKYFLTLITDDKIQWKNAIWLIGKITHYHKLYANRSIEHTWIEYSNIHPMT